VVLPSALPIQTYTDGHVHPIYAITTNLESTILLSASDRTLLVSDLVTAQCKRRYWGHTARIEYVTCLGGGNSSNNTAVDSGGGVVGEEIYASASYDSTVRLWDSRSRSNDPLMILADAQDAVTCVIQGSESQIVTSSVDGRIRTYDLRMARLITEDIIRSVGCHPSEEGRCRVPITSFSISSCTPPRSSSSNNGADSLLAASCLDGIIRIWNRIESTSSSSKRRRVYKLHSFHTSDKYKIGCTFTSDNKYIISGSECGGVAVYSLPDSSIDKSVIRGRKDYSGPATTTLNRHVGPTCSVAACPMISRPSLVLSASYDGTAIVWTSREEYDSCLDG
jgi:mitogen-activated protein kinase organizer 1